jgi:hypothetical protein
MKANEKARGGERRHGDSENAPSHPLIFTHAIYQADRFSKRQGESRRLEVM